LGMRDEPTAQINFLQKHDKDIKASISASVEEIGEINKILERHAELLNPNYVASIKNVPPGFRVSFVCPVTGTPLVREILDLCEYPGCQQRGVARCPKCETKRYCSSEHATIDLSNHQKECTPQRPCVTIRPQREPELGPGLCSIDISLQGRGVSTKASNEPLHGMKDSKVCIIVKVQVAPGLPLMIYNYDRAFKLMVTPKMIDTEAKGFYKLVALSQEHFMNPMQQSKCYLDAKIVNGSLVVYTDCLRDCKW
jgi:hypothetical protein